jgi:hypothetical protein
VTPRSGKSFFSKTKAPYLASALRLRNAGLEDWREWVEIMKAEYEYLRNSEQAAIAYLKLLLWNFSEENLTLNTNNLS